MSGAGSARAAGAKLINDALSVTAGRARCPGGVKRPGGGPNASGLAAEIVWVVVAVPALPWAGAAELPADATWLGFALRAFFFLSRLVRAAATCASADFLLGPTCTMIGFTGPSGAINCDGLMLDGAKLESMNAVGVLGSA